jgi:hypothetical protein
MDRPGMWSPAEGYNKDSPQADGLLAWYPMHMFGGNTDRDIVYNAVTGEKHKAVTGVDFEEHMDPVLGPFKTVYNGYVSTTTKVIPRAYPFTLTAWMRTSEYSTTRYVLGCGAGGSDSVRLGQNATGFILRRNFNETTVTTSDTSDFHLLIGTVWASNLCHLSMDNGTPVENTASVSLTFANWTDVQLFSDTDNVPFRGDVIDVRIYEKGFSASDRQHLWDPATRWDLYPPRNIYVPYGTTAAEEARTGIHLFGGGSGTYVTWR